jgi:tetratricopeptide (TPR) repeat protein
MKLFTSFVVMVVLASTAAHAQSNTSPSNTVHMMMMPATVAGSADIEAGAITQGIEKSLRAAQSRSATQRAAAYANLCIGYAKQANYADALIYCDKAVDEKRFEAIAHVNRGAVHYLMGNYTNSVSDLERALALNNTVVEAKKNLARAERSYAALNQGRQNLAEVPQK